MSSTPRARDLGVPFSGDPGPLNAITDVAGVSVGHTTLVIGDRVRTGVSVIHPLGSQGRGAVAAARSVINGTGEWTGMHMVDELGQLFGPIALTGTGNLGLVHQAMVAWSRRQPGLAEDEMYMRTLPVVGETLDAELHDVFSGAMTHEHVFAALDSAAAGAVEEGNVGGGTGMVAYRFKGGIGTASRVTELHGTVYTVGAMVQANHGRRSELRIAGMPIGLEVADLLPGVDARAAADNERRKSSLLIVLATDAPLQAHQLQRLARRACLGVGRGGSTAGNLSGEMTLAFSTAQPRGWDGATQRGVLFHDHDSDVLGPLFVAAVEAVEEALVNQLVASQTMVGMGGMQVHALPHDRLLSALRRYNRLP